MASKKDARRNSEEKNLECLRAEVEELKKQKTKLQELTHPSRIRTKESTSGSSIQKDQEEGDKGAVKRKPTNGKEHIVTKQDDNKEEKEEAYLEGFPRVESSSAKSKNSVTDELFEDPIDVAQMELIRLGLGGGVAMEGISAEAHGEKQEGIASAVGQDCERDLAVSTKDVDTERGNFQVRVPDFNKFLSVQSTDSDQENGSIKISVEFSEMRQRLLDLLSKNEELERQNAYYKRRVRSLDAERLEILKINYMWEEQHVKLSKEHKQALKEQERTILKLQRQLSQESKFSNHGVIEEKDAEILKLKHSLVEAHEELASLRKDITEGKAARQRLSALASNLDHVNTMLEEERKEKELIVQRETHSQQQIKAMESTIAVLETQVERGLVRRKLLEDEVRRLAQVINEISTNNGMSSSNGRDIGYADDQSSNFSRAFSNEQKEQIELLKHQIVTYKEDFKCEREEKERFIEENKKLKAELRTYRDKIVTLQRQVSVYESNFRNEREERIRLMRLTGQLPVETRRWEGSAPSQRFTQYTPYFSPRDVGGWEIAARSALAPESKEEEYDRLAEQREQLLRRMKELELYDVAKKRSMAMGQEPLSGSQGGLSRMQNERNRGEDLVPDRFGAPCSDVEQRAPCSPKIPTSCPRCGMSPESRREFLSHFDRCDTA